MHVDKDTFRGKLFIKFIKKYLKNLSKCKVLDVGCKYGAFTFELAKEFKKVVGIDINVEILDKIKNKLRYFKNVEIKEMNILNTEFQDNSFDLVILEGVLEWVGFSNNEKSPNECQIKALKECKRILKNYGILYVGIENRLFPYFWINDPHTHTPLTVILPHFFSNILYSIVKKRYYGIQIYNFWKYKKMFMKVFKNCEIMIPIPHYKYLYDVSTFNRHELRNKIDNLSKHTKNLRRSYQLILKILKLFSLIGLLKLFSPNFIILCKKINL